MQLKSHGGGRYKSIIAGTVIFAASATAAYISSINFNTASDSSAADLANAAKDVKAAANVETTMAMAITGDLVANIQPSADGSFSFASTTISVATNNQTGYNLSVMSNDDTTAMTHSSATISDKIASTASALTSVNMAKNTWGYTTASSISSSTTFNPIPTKGHAVEIKNTDGPSTSSTQDTKVSIGVKADTSIASGKYSNTLTFSAIANEVPITWDTIENMQDMTAEICSQAATPAASDTTVPTKTLIDTRDGKTYMVSKLADGHCWMSQSLALGGSSPITLTPADSNVTSNWTLPAADTSWVSSTTDPHYWVDNANQTAYGNYYNWPAATAGSGTSSVVSADAPQSICPKGWRLPKGGSTGEFANLITTTYGISSNAAGSTKLQSVPLGFQRSGYYNNGLKLQGSGGLYWSSTAYSSANYAYNLRFSSSVVLPMDYEDRNYGLTVRCLAE